MTEITDVIKGLKEKAKKRKFSQTFDLIIILKEFDLKKQDNKFSEDVALPHGRGGDAKVVVFADAVKNADCTVLTTNDLNRMATDKRELKNLAKSTDFFLAEAKLMPLVGKVLGQMLAPKGMMPRPITENVNELVTRLKKSVRVKVRDSPVIQAMVGKEDMADAEIEENVKVVLNAVEARLPRGKQNIRKIMLKLTMSEPVKIVM